MDAYVYQAALWCGPCMIKRLVEGRRASPGALDMEPAEALQQIVSANGFTGESDYDSDDLPRVHIPTAAEKPTPRSIATAAASSLRTPDQRRLRYVHEKLIEHARDGSGNAQVLKLGRTLRRRVRRAQQRHPRRPPVRVLAGGRPVGHDDELVVCGRSRALHPRRAYSRGMAL